MVVWSLASHAGVVLEPDPAAFAATVLWARPTHLAEPAARLAVLLPRLLELAGGRSPEARLRRHSRLRTVWWWGEPPLGQPEGDLLRRLGAEVAPLLAGLGSGGARGRYD